MELLIELASLQTAFLTLDEAIKTTNRRVNALDNVVVPRLENTISYIKVSKSFLNPHDSKKISMIAAGKQDPVANANYLHQLQGFFN